MMEEIAITRRVAARILGVRLRLFERVKTFNKTSTAELDADVKASFMAGLVEAEELHEIKIVGALLNPLYQNEARMIAGGLCTKPQYDAGLEELLDRLARHYERKARPQTDVGDTIYVNEWERPGLFDRRKTPRKEAEDEYAKYLSFMKAARLPREMEAVRVLGAFTDDGDPRPNPVYVIGRVIEPGDTFIVTKDNSNRKCNHANFIDKTGHYDLMSYLDLVRDECPSIYEVGRGLVGSHVSSEVDCESLFSQADLVADARRSSMDIRFYERMVIAKHRLNNVYCHIPNVVELYLQRWREDDWDEGDERDAKEFLKLEKEIYLEKYPQNNGIFHSEHEVEEEEEALDKDEVECVKNSKPSATAAKGKAAKGRASKGKMAQEKKVAKKRKAATNTGMEDKDKEVEVVGVDC